MKQTKSKNTNNYNADNNNNNTIVLSITELQSLKDSALPSFFYTLSRNLRAAELLNLTGNSSTLTIIEIIDHENNNNNNNTIAESDFVKELLHNKKYQPGSSIISEATKYFVSSVFCDLLRLHLQQQQQQRVEHKSNNNSLSLFNFESGEDALLLFYAVVFPFYHSKQQQQQQQQHKNSFENGVFSLEYAIERLCASEALKYILPICLTFIQNECHAKNNKKYGINNSQCSLFFDYLLSLFEAITWLDQPNSALRNAPNPKNVNDSTILSTATTNNSNNSNNNNNILYNNHNILTTISIELYKVLVDVVRILFLDNTKTEQESNNNSPIYDEQCHSILLFLLSVLKKNSSLLQQLAENNDDCNLNNMNINNKNNNHSKTVRIRTLSNAKNKNNHSLSYDFVSKLLLTEVSSLQFTFSHFIIENYFKKGWRMEKNNVLAVVKNEEDNYENNNITATASNNNNHHKVALQHISKGFEFTILLSELHLEFALPLLSFLLNLNDQSNNPIFDHFFYKTDFHSDNEEEHRQTNANTSREDIMLLYIRGLYAVSLCQYQNLFSPPNDNINFNYHLEAYKKQMALFFTQLFNLASQNHNNNSNNNKNNKDINNNVQMVLSTKGKVLVKTEMLTVGTKCIKVAFSNLLQSSTVSHHNNSNNHNDNKNTIKDNAIKNRNAFYHYYHLLVQPFLSCCLTDINVFVRRVAVVQLCQLLKHTLLHFFQSQQLPREGDSSLSFLFLSCFSGDHNAALRGEGDEGGMNNNNNNNSNSYNNNIFCHLFYGNNDSGERKIDLRKVLASRCCDKKIIIREVAITQFCELYKLALHFSGGETMESIYQYFQWIPAALFNAFSFENGVFMIETQLETLFPSIHHYDINKNNNVQNKNELYTYQNNNKNSGNEIKDKSTTYSLQPSLALFDFEKESEISGANKNRITNNNINNNNNNHNFQNEEITYADCWLSFIQDLTANDSTNIHFYRLLFIANKKYYLRETVFLLFSLRNEVKQMVQTDNAAQNNNNTNNNNNNENEQEYNKSALIHKIHRLLLFLQQISHSENQNVWDALFRSRDDVVGKLFLRLCASPLSSITNNNNNNNNSNYIITEWSSEKNFFLEKLKGRVQSDVYTFINTTLSSHLCFPFSYRKHVKQVLGRVKTLIEKMNNNNNDNNAGSTDDDELSALKELMPLLQFLLVCVTTSPTFLSLCMPTMVIILKSFSSSRTKGTSQDATRVDDIQKREMTLYVLQIMYNWCIFEGTLASHNNNSNENDDENGEDAHTDEDDEDGRGSSSFSSTFSTKYYSYSTALHRGNNKDTKQDFFALLARLSEGELYASHVFNNTTKNSNSNNNENDNNNSSDEIAIEQVTKISTLSAKLFLHCLLFFPQFQSEKTIFDDVMKTISSKICSAAAPESNNNNNKNSIGVSLLCSVHTLRGFLLAIQDAPSLLSARDAHARSDQRKRYLLYLSELTEGVAIHSKDALKKLFSRVLRPQPLSPAELESDKNSHTHKSNPEFQNFEAYILGDNNNNNNNFPIISNLYTAVASGLSKVLALLPLVSAASASSAAHHSDTLKNELLLFFIQSFSVITKEFSSTAHNNNNNGEESINAHCFHHSRGCCQRRALLYYIISKLVFVPSTNLQNELIISFLFSAEENDLVRHYVQRCLYNNIMTQRKVNGHTSSFGNHKSTDMAAKEKSNHMNSSYSADDETNCNFFYTNLTLSSFTGEDDDYKAATSSASILFSLANQPSRQQTKNIQQTQTCHNSNYDFHGLFFSPPSGSEAEKNRNTFRAQCDMRYVSFLLMTVMKEDDTAPNSYHHHHHNSNKQYYLTVLKLNYLPRIAALLESKRQQQQAENNNNNNKNNNSNIQNTISLTSPTAFCYYLELAIPFLLFFLSHHPLLFSENNSNHADDDNGAHSNSKAHSELDTQCMHVQRVFFLLFETLLSRTSASTVDIENGEDNNNNNNNNKCFSFMLAVLNRIKLSKDILAQGNDSSMNSESDKNNNHRLIADIASHVLYKVMENKKEVSTHSLKPYTDHILLPNFFTKISNGSGGINNNNININTLLTRHFADENNITLYSTAPFRLPPQNTNTNAKEVCVERYKKRGRSHAAASPDPSLQRDVEEEEEEEEDEDVDEEQNENEHCKVQQKSDRDDADAFIKEAEQFILLGNHLNHRDDQSPAKKNKTEAAATPATFQASPLLTSTPRLFATSNLIRHHNNNNINNINCNDNNIDVYSTIDAVLANHLGHLSKAEIAAAKWKTIKHAITNAVINSSALFPSSIATDSTAGRLQTDNKNNNNNAFADAKKRKREVEKQEMEKYYKYAKEKLGEMYMNAPP